VSRSSRMIALFDRERGICWLCGADVGHVRHATRDHVIPRSVYETGCGFTNVIRLAHRKCNEARGVDPPTRPEAKAFYDRVVAQYNAAHLRPRDAHPDWPAIRRDLVKRANDALADAKLWESTTRDQPRTVI